MQGRAGLAFVRAIAVAAGIGFAIVPLLGFVVGIPLRGSGFQLELLTTAGFCGAGLVAAVLAGGAVGWFGLLIGLLTGLFWLPEWGTSSVGFGSLFDAAVALAYLGWGLTAGSVGYAIGSYIAMVRRAGPRTRA